MVKNTTGGKKSKKLARKSVRAANASYKLREAEEGEMYALVTKPLGNGMAYVLCNDKKERLLHIRKKFTGRRKRDNNVVRDVMVLVAPRSWEVTSKKIEKADLLFVYSENDVSKLKKLQTVKDYILPVNHRTNCDDNDDDFDYVDNDVQTTEQGDFYEMMEKKVAEEDTGYGNDWLEDIEQKDSGVIEQKTNDSSHKGKESHNDDELDWDNI